MLTGRVSESLPPSNGTDSLCQFIPSGSILTTGFGIPSSQLLNTLDNRFSSHVFSHSNQIGVLTSTQIAIRMLPSVMGYPSLTYVRRRARCIPL